jgi:hypothetical protein
VATMATSDSKPKRGDRPRVSLDKMLIAFQASPAHRLRSRHGFRR